MSNATTKEIFDAGIEMTKKAADRLAAVMEGEGKKGFGLRMEVTTGGCSGLNYNMSFEEKQKEFDKVFESQGLRIFCDLKSYLYCLLYTSPSPRDVEESRMPSSA